MLRGIVFILESLRNFLEAQGAKQKEQCIMFILTCLNAAFISVHRQIKGLNKARAKAPKDKQNKGCLGIERKWDNFDHFKIKMFTLLSDWVRVELLCFSMISEVEEPLKRVLALVVSINICSDEGLTLEMSSFVSLYGDQFTLSKQLIKPNIPFHSHTDATKIILISLPFVHAFQNFLPSPII